MSNSRREYIIDLVEDCLTAVDETQIPPDQRGPVIAALILADSLNGLRKSILQLQPSAYTPRKQTPSGY